MGTMENNSVLYALKIICAVVFLEIAPLLIIGLIVLCVFLIKKFIEWWF